MNDFFGDGQGQMDFMGDGKDDPKKRKKNLLIFVIGANLIFNLIYYLIYFLDGKSFVYKILHDLTHFLTYLPTISLFLYVQLIVAVLYFFQLKNKIIPRTKENIFSFIHIINFIILTVLVNNALLSYLGNFETVNEFGFLGFTMLIISGTLFSLNVKNMFFDIKETIMNIINPPEEEEEVVEEEAFDKYSWISRYYKEGYEPKTKLSYYRFMYGEIFPHIIGLINQTLEFEKGKLLPKDIIENEDESLYVQVDYPDLENDADVEEFISEMTFNNEYIKINDTFVGLKLRTKFLRGQDHLLKIGEDILPNQIRTLLDQIPFNPIKKLDPNGPEYQKMLADYRGKPYLLFDGVSIQPFGAEFYVILNYTKIYRQLVIFPQMKTLPTVLEEEDVEMFGPKPDAMIYLGMRAVGGFLNLTLGKIKHLLFGGETGSGKSVFLRSVIYQILFASTPDTVKLVLIDPLQVSFQIFKKLKSLAFPLATSVEEANEAINFLYKTNNERYGFLQNLGYEDIYSFNKDVGEKIINIKDKETGIPEKFRLENNRNPKYENLEILTKDKYDLYSRGEYKINSFIPQIVLLYDEFNAYNGEPIYERNGSLETLSKIGEQARKAGIIMILGTQTINADSVPTALRNNLKTRVCLTVSSKPNSRAILGDAPSNKSDGNLLSGSGDMLVFNSDALDGTTAIRAQAFFVSEGDMIELVKENLEMFGKNDFLYKDKDDSEYEWVKYFYATEKKLADETGVYVDSIIERNKKEYDSRRINFEYFLPIIIEEMNSFFKIQRNEIVDKLYLESKEKNIIINNLKFQTSDELAEKFEGMKYSNTFFEISEKFLKLKLDTSFLSGEDKLLKMEEKLSLQMNELRQKITFEPIKPYNLEKEKDSDTYKKMMELTNGVPYTLIDNFQITKNKNGFYVQLNFTKWYIDTVVFPNSKTVRQVLSMKYGNVIEEMLGISA